MRIAALGLLVTWTASAAAAEPRWREADVWRQPSGLPQDSVMAVLQTRDGYIWAGTRAGVTRFDGVRFTTYDDRDKTQLRENEVWALLEDDDGSLWIGIYGGGLSRLRAGRFTVYGTRDGLVDDFVRGIVKDAEGALWIGTDRGLSRFKAGVFTSYTTKDGLHSNLVRTLLASPDGGVLVATQGGLQQIKDGRVEAFRVPALAPLGLVEALARDRTGALWIATADGLVRVANGNAVRFTKADGLSSSTVRRVHEDRAGRIWIATAAGIDRYRGRDAPLFANEAASNDITALHGDREGGLWVGHRGAGLSRFHQGIFSSYTAEDGLPDSETTTVLHGRHASWVGTINGLSLLHQGRFTALGAASGLPPGPISALAEDSAGRLWVGTASGLFRSAAAIDCGEPRCVPRFDALRQDPVLASHARVLFEDRRGAMWVGTDHSGLVQVANNRVTTLTTGDGLSHDSIRALAEAHDGSLWIGTKGGGLVRLKDGVFTTFLEKDGLPNSNIQALYADADDTLWIATRQGVSRLKSGRFTTYSVKDGLFWSHVYSFLEDDLGYLWMTSGKGVFRVSKRQLDDFAEGRRRSIVSIAYGREHGLPSSMAAVATWPGAAKSKDGRVWFAIVGGLAVADPKRLPTNEAAPPVHVEEARVDGRALDVTAAGTAPAGRGDFSFRYTALSYEAPLAVTFKYRLEGFDADWVDADTRRVAYYTNMPPGAYRFRVIAGNSDGVWNEEGAEVAFTLAPHFYETRWFYAAIAVGLVLAGAGTQRLRVRVLEARERELRARVDAALAEVKVLSGLLPICAACKMIRDDSGAWSQMEAYIHTHSEAQFSHGICPECSEKLYPGVAQRIRDRKATEL